jgi:two-component system, LuxR family, response regulator DctR
MSTPTIHIVDDDADFRDGLSWLFDSRGHHCQTWAGGDVFVQAVRDMPKPWSPAVVVMDIRMEPVSGLAAFDDLKAMQCPWPVVFLTGHGDVGMAVGAIKNGAWDFLEKPFQNNILVDKVEQALTSVLSVDSQRSQQLRNALENLSPREKEVLNELLLGHYNKTIADHLGITQRTVEFHRANIFSKMGVSSAIELAHLVGRHVKN